MEFENEDQRNDPELILAKMKEYCNGECNETYERYVFNHRDQESNESVDASVTALRKLAKTCSYGSLTDSLIRDIEWWWASITILLVRSYCRQASSH